MITLASLRSWAQLTQATEKPPGETAGWAPADVATEVLERQDVKSVLGRQVRSRAAAHRVSRVALRPASGSRRIAGRRLWGWGRQARRNEARRQDTRAQLGQRPPSRRASNPAAAEA